MKVLRMINKVSKQLGVKNTIKIYDLINQKANNIFINIKKTDVITSNTVKNYQKIY